MTQLTYSQIEGYWIKAGGSKALAPIMAAIAMAESGGRTDAHNGNGATGDDSYGLWQINYFGSLLPGRTAEYGPPESMFDPANNAKAAVALAGNGAGLGNWTTYTGGAYRQYLNNSSAPATDLPLGSGGRSGTTGGSTTGNAQDASFLSGLAGALGDVGKFLTHTPSALSGGGTPYGDVQAVPKDMYGAVKDMAGYAQDALTLFVALFRPSFWLRVGAFVVGIIAASGGLYFILSGSTGVNATDIAMRKGLK